MPTPSVLFIAPPDPDEAVLASGALAHVLADLGEAAVTVVTPPEAAGLYRALPGLSALHAWDKNRAFGEWIALALKHATDPFDIVLDLSGAPGGYAIRAHRRIARRTPQALMRRTQEYAALFNTDAPQAPVLWLDQAASDAAAAVADEGPLLVLAPAGRAQACAWPAENFAAVARRLVGGPLANACIVLLGFAEDAPVTGAIAASLDADGLAARDLAGELDLLGAGALLERATLALGVDNLWTQIAAVTGAPTLALFGPTDERVRGPYGPRVRTLRGIEFEAAMGLPTLAERSLLADISVDQVEAAAVELLRAGGLR